MYIELLENWPHMKLVWSISIIFSAISLDLKTWIKGFFFESLVFPFNFSKYLKVRCLNIQQLHFFRRNISVWYLWAWGWGIINHSLVLFPILCNIKYIFQQYMYVYIIIYVVENIFVSVSIDFKIAISIYQLI